MTNQYICICGQSKEDCSREHEKNHDDDCHHKTSDKDCCPCCGRKIVSCPCTGQIPPGIGNPNRPGKTTGTDRGRTPGGGPLTKGDINSDNPPNSWAGPRKNLFMPFLFMRANPGDTGTRPVVGPFWESPDILLVAGVEPAVAPARPLTLGQTALAGQPNTVYAHIWNFGQALAPEVVVEFYWCDPSLGIGPGSAHIIGQTIISLGARGSGKSHALVKCPEAWVPTFLNGGHECLLVRAWDLTSDGLGSPPWDASLNRHCGQRNIHVIANPAAPVLHPLAAGPHATSRAIFSLMEVPLILKVGPLYGMPAQINVERITPGAMPWLQLHTGVRGKFPSPAVPTGVVALSPPSTIGGGFSTGTGANQQQVNTDDQQLAFTSTDSHPAPGEAHVYRVTAIQNGQVFGGYTVVMAGS
jgi:hypothetical protein